MPEYIKVKTDCPICKKIVAFDVDSDLISNSTRFPVQFLIEHCDKTFIAFVNQNFEVKGLQSFTNILDKKEIETQGKFITPEFIENVALEEKLVLSCNSDYDTLMKQQLPNVLEKQILLGVAKVEEISIAVLLKKIKPLEKALNMTIDQETLLNIVDKYVNKGILNKNLIKFDKEKLNFNEVKTNLRGDVM